MPTHEFPDCHVSRVDGAEVFFATGTTGDYLVTIADGAATCSCPATATCKHVRTVLDRANDPLVGLAATVRDRDLLEQRERTLVQLAREAGVSWHRIAVSLGLTAEGCRRRYAREGVR